MLKFLPLVFLLFTVGCGEVKFKDGFKEDPALMCQPNGQTFCSISNGIGIKTCNADGKNYGSCNPTGCDVGYSLIGGQCIIQVCSPNSTASCSFMNLVGTKTCNAQGSGYGLCITGNQCQSGFVLIGGVCVAQSCSPNTSQSCQIANGQGSQTCNSLGTAYGSCQVTNCNAGFYQSGNTCVAQTCTPSSTQSCLFNHFVGTQTCNAQGSGYGSCVPSNTCEQGYYLSNGQCLPQTCSPNSTSSCNQNNGSGIKTCNAQGSAYGSCVINSCDVGYTLINGSCVQQTCTPNSVESCQTVDHFQGSRMCNANGTGFSICQPTPPPTCAAGYTLVNGQCVAQACTPNSTASCQEGNGSGTKTCNPQGSAYGQCVLNSCNAGFTLINGQCVAQTCQPNSTAVCSVANGTGSKTCNPQGTDYGSCTPTSCNAGYSLINGQCVQQSCTPNAVESCDTVDHQVGTRTCNPQGTGFAICEPTQPVVCSSGYYLSNGQCLPQLCSPNSTASCPIANGTGSKTCNAQGSAYGSCTPTSCNAGYSLVNGQCVQQSCTPNAVESCETADHFQGSRTCNAQGTGFAICEPTPPPTCASGYFLSNGQCLPLICQPNSTATCSVANGQGTKMCNAQGSAYGSCTPTNCDAGYVLQNGQCVPQSCTPNAVESCETADHFQGSRTCNAQGTDFGTCQPTPPPTCASGYYLSNGQCLPQACTPNSTASCPVSNGTGTKTCDAQGSAYGSCTVNSCDAGFTLVNGQCVAVSACIPYEERSCTIVGSGTGKQFCHSNGQWGSCTAVSCNAGHVKTLNPSTEYTFCANENQTCVVNTNGAQVKYGKGLVYTADKTVNQQIACNNAEFGDPLQGTAKNCLVKGIFSCDPIQLVCTPFATTSCSVPNGVGMRTCAADGMSYGACTPVNCSAGYILSNGQCISEQCSVPNGSGTLTKISNNKIEVTHELVADLGATYSYHIRLKKTPASQFTDWSMCFYYDYNVGNVLITEAFVDPSSSKPNWKLIPVTSPRGSHVNINWTALPGNVGSDRITNIKVFATANASCQSLPIYSTQPVCVPNSCSSGYHLEDNQCKSNVRTCSVPGGTGTQTWNGTAYGPCGNVTCTNPTYALINVDLQGRTQECAGSCPLGLLKILLGGVYVCL